MAMNVGAKTLESLDLGGTAVIEKLKAQGCEPSQASVSQWKSGFRRPTPSARRAMSRAFGIPTVAWDEDVVVPDPAPAPSIAVEKQEAVGPSVQRALLPSNEDPTAAELARDLLTRIQLFREQSETTSLGVQGRKTLAEMEGKAIERYSRLSGQSMTEREVIGSPHFRRVLDEMFAVLEKYPEALRALRAALSDAEAA